MKKANTVSETKKPEVSSPEPKPQPAAERAPAVNARRDELTRDKECMAAYHGLLNGSLEPHEFEQVYIGAAVVAMMEGHGDTHPFEALVSDVLLAYRGGPESYTVSRIQHIFRMWQERHDMLLLHLRGAVRAGLASEVARATPEPFSEDELAFRSRGRNAECLDAYRELIAGKREPDLMDQVRIGAAVLCAEHEVDINWPSEKFVSSVLRSFAEANGTPDRMAEHAKEFRRDFSDAQEKHEQFLKNFPRLATSATEEPVNAGA